MIKPLEKKKIVFNFNSELLTKEKKNKKSQVIFVTDKLIKLI